MHLHRGIINLSLGVFGYNVLQKLENQLNSLVVNSSLKSTNSSKTKAQMKDFYKKLKRARKLVVGYIFNVVPGQIIFVMVY